MPAQQMRVRSISVVDGPSFNSPASYLVDGSWQDFGDDDPFVVRFCLGPVVKASFISCAHECASNGRSPCHLRW